MEQKDNICNNNINNNNYKRKNTKSHVRKKYKKNKTEFEKNINYIFIKDENDNRLIWNYSLSSFYYKTYTGYYYCSDTQCKSRIIFRFCNNVGISEFQKIKEKSESYELTKNHSKDFNEHNYYNKLY